MPENELRLAAGFGIDTEALYGIENVGGGGGGGVEAEAEAKGCRQHERVHFAIYL